MQYFLFEFGKFYADLAVDKFNFVNIYSKNKPSNGVTFFFIGLIKIFLVRDSEFIHPIRCIFSEKWGKFC